MFISFVSFYVLPVNDSPIPVFFGLQNARIVCQGNPGMSQRAKNWKRSRRLKETRSERKINCYRVLASALTQTRRIYSHLPNFLNSTLSLSRQRRNQFPSKSRAIMTNRLTMKQSSTAETVIWLIQRSMTWPWRQKCQTQSVSWAIIPDHAAWTVKRNKPSSAVSPSYSFRCRCKKGFLDCIGS